MLCEQVTKDLMLYARRNRDEAEQCKEHENREWWDGYRTALAIALCDTLPDTLVQKVAEAVKAERLPT